MVFPPPLSPAMVETGVGGGRAALGLGYGGSRRKKWGEGRAVWGWEMGEQENVCPGVIFE